MRGGVHATGESNRGDSFDIIIVYILADDLGYGDVSTLNPERGKGEGASVGAVTRDGPVTLGFDHFFGFYHARMMKSVFENDHVTQIVEPVDMLPLLASKSASRTTHSSSSPATTVARLLRARRGSRNRSTSPADPIAATRPTSGMAGIAYHFSCAGRQR